MESMMQSELEEKIVKAAKDHVRWAEKAHINDQIPTAVKLRSLTSELINLELIYKHYMKVNNLIVAFRDYEMSPNQVSKEGLLTLSGWMGLNVSTDLTKKDLLKILKKYYY